MWEQVAGMSDLTSIARHRSDPVCDYQRLALGHGCGIPGSQVPRSRYLQRSVPGSRVSPYSCLFRWRIRHLQRAPRGVCWQIQRRSRETAFRSSQKLRSPPNLEQLHQDAQ